MYKVIKNIVGIALRIFYKKLFFYGRENIPKKEPMLLACSHSNGLIDPIIPPPNLRRDIHFITRGDVFKKQFLWFFNSIHMIPIFRFKDGYTSMKTNMSVFQGVHDKLANGSAILIFPESFTIPVKRLRPLEKGTARMAFGAMESSDIPDIKIVPLGINFTYPSKARSIAYLMTGNPISVKEYWPEYQINKQAAFRKLTARIREEMSPLVIHVADENDDNLAEALLRINRTKFPVNILPTVESTSEAYHREKRITDQINEMDEVDKEDPRIMAAKYISFLDKNHIHDENIGKLKSLPFHFTIGLLLVIPTIIGLLLHGLPYLVGNWYTDKKVNYLKFYTTVLFPSLMVAFIVYYLILLVFFCLLYGWLGILWLLGVMLLGWVSMNGLEYFKMIRGNFRLHRLPEAERQQLDHWRNDLKKLIDS